MTTKQVLPVETMNLKDEKMRNSSNTTVIESRENGIVVLTIDNPPANTLDNATIGLLTTSLKRHGLSVSDVRVIILTAEGTRFFSPGGDIKELDGLTCDDGVERIRASHELACVMERLDVPIVCAINGDAVGGGTELCLFADYRIAVKHARFGMPEVKNGLLPAARSIQQAVRLLGLRVTRRLLYGGELIGAEEAVRIGLVDHVVEGNEALRGEARAWAESIAAKPRELIVPIKRTIRLTGQLSDELVEEMAVSDFRRYFGSEEARQQLRAVLSRWNRPSKD